MSPTSSCSAAMASVSPPKVSIRNASHFGVGDFVRVKLTGE